MLFIRYVLVIILGLTSSNLINGFRILVSYPVAKKETRFLMRNIALFFAEENHDVTVLSTDSSPLLRHHNIKNHLVDLSKATTKLPFCKTAIKYIIGCDIAAAISRTTRAFWSDPEVDDLYHNEKPFDVLIAPVALNEFSYPFIYNTTGTLMLVKSAMPGSSEFQSNLHFSLNSNKREAEESIAEQFDESYLQSLENETSLIHQLKKFVFAGFPNYRSFIQGEISKILPEVKDVFA